MLSAFQYRDYRILWLGVTMHAVTLWMEIVARNWLVYEMTDSLIALGWVNFWRTIPVLFLAIPAGVLADRVSRKVILVTTQLGILVIYVVLVVMLLADTLQLWHTYALFAARGAMIAFNQPARQALIPAIVREDDVPNAVALQQLSFNGMRIAGPILAGFLFGWLGSASAFIVIVLLEFAIIGAWLFMKSYKVAARAHAAGRISGPLDDAWQGLKYAFRNRTILVLLVLGLISLMFIQPFIVILPRIADARFGIGPEGFGAFLSFMGVGAVFGPALLAYLGNVRYKGALIIVSMVLSGMLLAALGAAPWLVLAFGLIVVLGLFDSSQRVITNSLLLTQTDREFHGRVISLYLLDRGFVPIGSVAAGYLADSAGPTVALAILGGALVCSVLMVAVVRPKFLSVR